MRCFRHKRKADRKRRLLGEESERNSTENKRFRTHESRKSRTTLKTNGLGQMISRLPLGICRTRLVELGATVTILEPLSTARLIEGVSFSPPAPPLARLAKDSVCSTADGPV